TVLEAINTSGAPGTPATPIPLCPATQVAVANGRAVFLRPGSAGATTLAKLPHCPAGTPDPGSSVYFWPGSGDVQDLGREGLSVAITDGVDLASTYIGAIEPINPGGPLPGIVTVGAADTGFLDEIGQLADTLQACGGVFAFITPEAVPGENLYEHLNS